MQLKIQDQQKIFKIVTQHKTISVVFIVKLKIASNYY